MKRPSRRVTAAGAAVAVTLGTAALSGCSHFSPVQSVQPYTPADGVVANLGPLAVRNLLIVSAGADQPGVLSGALINTGTTEVAVTFTTAGSTAASDPVQVPAGRLVTLGDGSGAIHIQISAVQAPPGALEQVAVATPETGPSTLQVPVLSPNLQYATITPTPTPTDTPTDTPTAP